MKIIVTGGAGFIGSQVTDAYIAAGHEVIVVDDLSTGKRENLNPQAKFYQLDISAPELEEVFRTERPDVVNHHAAQKSVPKSVEDPVLDASINVIGLLNVLNLCVKYEVKRFIGVSSGGALAGENAPIPTKETDEPSLISPYAISKYVGEKYLNFYSLTHGLTYVGLRYANVYGPRQVAEGECGVIPIFMDNLLADQPSSLFAYADMPRGTTRDYVHVTDIARANVLALTKGDNEVLNIGAGVELYIEDIYYEVEKAFGKQIPLIRKSERVGDIKRSALDASKAKALLGWEPQIGLEEGLKHTLAWKLAAR
ncbi:MAG: NAD-dependent epimerase/dehydratase family protein [Tumebacillaceae bacterium]